MDTETSRSTRQVPPAHYMLKVESYSFLSESKIKFDSPSFRAGGYKWRLSFYPNGDKRFNAAGNYISLYLTVCETVFLPVGWEIIVNFTLFVYNYIHDNYLTLQATRRFHERKKEWGFEQLESLETFKDLSKGYLLDDSCTFGAEVFVINPTLNFATFSLFRRENISNPTFRWEIKEFCKASTFFDCRSVEFSSGGDKWWLGILCPNVEKRTEGEALPMLLFFLDNGILNNKSTVYADYRLRVIDQLNSKHKEFSAKEWFGPSFGCHLSKMMLKDLLKSSSGFVVEDTVIVEVEFFVMSRTQVSQS